MMDAFRNEMGYGTNTGVADTSAGIQNALAKMGPAATGAGLFNLANFTPTGGTQYNLDAAGQYADNPAFPGMVQAAMRDANQNYTDTQVPAMARNAAGTGNINSTAPSIQQGIVERGLAQKAADISSTLRGNAWSKGIDTAQNQATMDTQARLGALYGLTNGGNAASSGAVGAGSGSVNQASGLFDIANTGAANLNAGNQADLNNQMQAWQFGTNGPFAALNNYWNIVGNNQWGSQSTNQSRSNGTGTSTTTSTPSLMSSIMSGVGMAGSLMKSDVRSKTDIAAIGKLDDGQTVYRFRYTDAPEAVHIGLMAQEVERRHPEAVVEINGVKHVDYDLATRHAAFN